MDIINHSKEFEIGNREKVHKKTLIIHCFCFVVSHLYSRSVYEAFFCMTFFYVVFGGNNFR